MPLAVSFNAACARGLGLGNGEAPRAPVINTPSADDTTIGGAVGAAIAYTITVTTFPISYVEYKLDKINSSNAVTDAGQFTGSLPGASGSNSTTLSTRITSTGSSENLIYDQKYALYLRSVDGSGQIGPESLVRRFTTSNEAAPTAVAPTLASTSVSYDTAPFISITWAAGTAGTYAIGTRKYSVVAGTAAAGADNTFTAVTGSTGTVSVTTTYAGVAILPNTQYTVYMKYAASSPGVTSATASATITTAAEIVASAPTISLASTPTTITITRGNVPTPPTPTYLYKYQYAYGTSATPTNYADFSTSGTTQTITGLLHATTFYVSIKAVSLVTGASGAISSTSIATQAEVAPTFTFTSENLTSTSVSYNTPPFISIAYTAGTAGTYAIGTRKYSVVLGTGAAGADDTFTTINGSSPVSVTTTAAGAAILPNTQYTVHMKYIATSPGTASTPASATHTTAAEILASAPSVSLASTPTTITITRGDVPTPPIPTYLYKYQYAYGTTVDPTNFADFPSTGTASSVTLTGLTTNTTYYVRVRAIATGGALSPGTASSASIATSNEVAPTFTFTSANLTSTSVSYSTPPFISIAYTAGTAGTYAIGTRQYSVVAGTGAAGTFTTISVSSPFSVTTTHAGVAILPGTQYTVYMKYIATSPGVTSTIISATHTTAAEILADAPTVSLASAPTTITVTRGNYTSSPTYQQKYQYAYGTTVDPTNFADFPTSGTASSVTIPDLLHATTHHVRVRAIATGGALSPGAASSASIATTAEVAPTFTFVNANLTSTSVSSPTRPFISIAYTAGTAGTYAIDTRKYSVVAGTGAAGADNTFTTISESSPVSVTTTAASATTAGSFVVGTTYEIASVGTTNFTLIGAISNTVGVQFRATGVGTGTGTVKTAILPGTLYTVYMKYTAITPGTASLTKSATHTTAAEILASAPSLSHTSDSTSITITRGNHTNSPAPTYLQNYQYAISTTNPPTEFVYFPNFGFDSVVEIPDLMHATPHYLLIRARATAGALSPGATSSATRSTAAEVAPTAVAPTFATATQLSITFTYAAGTKGTYTIGTRQYSVVAGTGAAGTFTTVSGSTGTVSVATTHAGVAILPGTQYTVYMKYIATSPGSTSTTASATHTTADEVLANQITAAVARPADTNDGRTQLVITRGNYSNSPTYLANYQYAIGTSDNPTNWEFFGNWGFDSTVTVTGLSSETLYYVRTRAIATGGALSPGTASVSASATTHPALPPTPTIAWRSMSSSSYGTALFTVTGNGGSTSVVKIFRRTASGSNTGAEEFTRGTGNQQITGHASDGGTAYYVAYNYNSLNERSTASNQIAWTRPTKDVPKVWTGNTSGQTYYPNYTYVIETNACEPYRLAITFPSSGIAATEDEPGYQRVDLISALMMCGNNINSGVKNALCNITNLRFSYATIGSESSANGAKPTIYTGHATLGTSPEEFVFRTVSVGGTALHNKVFMVTVQPGSGFRSWNSGCNLSTAGDYFSGKKIQLTGVETTGGTIVN